MLEFEMAQPWRNMPLAFVDVETTGLDTETDRVVEIGIFSLHGSTVVERWVQLVHPGCPIPRPASAVHGITNETVESHPSFRDINWEVYHRLRGKLLIAYNGLQFDVPMLAAEMRRCGLTLPIQPVLDPMLWNLRPSGTGGLSPVSLKTACQRLGVEIAHAHRVAGDCEALVALSLRLTRQVPELLGDLLEAQTTWSRKLQAWKEDRNARRRRLGVRRQSPQGALPLNAEGPLDSDNE